jgi:hypothetical protein
LIIEISERVSANIGSILFYTMDYSFLYMPLYLNNEYFTMFCGKAKVKCPRDPTTDFNGNHSFTGKGYATVSVQPSPNGPEQCNIT